jgi:capsular exopolysaccharide synthesis family protein
MQDMSPLSLQNLVYVIRAHRWLLLAVATILFAAGAAFVFSLKPAYTAQGVVLLAPMTEQLDASPAGRAATMTDPFFIRSEAAIISSDDLARSVIKALNLTHVAEFAPEPGAHPFLTDEEAALDAVLRTYRERLSVFNDGRSKTVEITFEAGDPRLAARIVNAHAEAYLRDQTARRSAVQQKSLQWLRQEVDARAREARDADALVHQYQVQNGIVGTGNSTMVEQRLSQLSAQLVDARRQLSTQKSMLEEIRALRAGGDPANAATLLDNEPLTDLLRSRVQAEATLASLQTRLAENHPTLVKQRQALASINEVLDRQLVRAENEAAAAAGSWERQVRDLTRAVGDETSNKLSQDQASAALPALMAEAGVKRTVLETVLNRYQTQLAEQGFSEPTAIIVSRAEPPARPSFPRKALFLAVALLVAACGGIGAALIVEMMRPTPRGLNALADAVGIRPLVSIARFRNEANEPGVVKIRDPKFYIESIRSLRNALFEHGTSRTARVCLFTSVVPSEGKTLVAMSVARSLARSGLRALFLEMDLRCPAASRLAHLPQQSRGVAAVLEARAQVADTLQRDASTGLDMLLAEKNAGLSLDRLTANAIAGLLEKLRPRYDAIIIDSPPVGVISDSLTLANVADQTVLVTRERESSVGRLGDAVRLLRDRGASLAGLVITDVDPKRLALDELTVERYVTGTTARMSLVKSSA